MAWLLEPVASCSICPLLRPVDADFLPHVQDQEMSRRKEAMPYTTPAGCAASAHYLLVALLLRYRGGYQPGLTRKHMTVQVEGRQVAT